MNASHEEKLQELSRLKFDLETSILKDRGSCLTCRGSGRQGHRSQGGTGIFWPCTSCGGSGQAKKAA